MLRTVDVERLIPQEHPARAIWELVGNLDLSRYYEGIRAVEGVAGRTALDPQVLISLWVYAYSDGVGAAREVSRLCETDPAYQWLTGMEPINHHSLSDFRVEHKEALDGLFVQVLGVLSAEGLVTLQRVTQDGTKIKANASGKSFRRKNRIREHLELARRQVRAMGDPAAEEVTLRRKKAQERAAREREKRLEQALREVEQLQLEKGAEARASMTDPEARVMKQSDGGFAPSYNTQINTDAQAGVIVAVDITKAGNDIDQLVAGMDQVKENLGHEPLQVIADGGYVSNENILAMNDRKIDFVGPAGEGDDRWMSRLKALGITEEFYPGHFRYDETHDVYICPQGKVLNRQARDERVGRTNYRYQAKTSDCRDCPFKTKCCPKSKKGRVIVRGVDNPVVADFHARMQSAEVKEIYRIRSQVAEFSNAWIKEKIGLRQFRVRGLFKAKMEAVWACLTYNVQQWIRLCWKPKLAGAAIG